MPTIKSIERQLSIAAFVACLKPSEPLGRGRPAAASTSAIETVSEGWQPKIDLVQRCGSHVGTSSCKKSEPLCRSKHQSHIL